MAKYRPAPKKMEDVVEHILEDSDVIWLPIRHFSPACAWHVRKELRRIQPVAVLVEGPEDATPLIQALVHEDTKPPVTLLSTWVDKRNGYGANGQLSATEQVAARFRGWWPLVSWSPEYHALRTGAELGAELRFIDMSVKASVPFSYVPAGERVRSVQERHQAESAFFSALAKRTRSDDFDGFWRAAFEMGAQRQSSEAFFRSLLTFAWCARNVHVSAEALELWLKELSLCMQMQKEWCGQRWNTSPCMSSRALTASTSS